MIRRLLRFLSPVRVQHGSSSRGDFILYVGEWYMRFTFGGPSGRFSNGSSWRSPIGNWKREAAEYGPCYDLCSCATCWNGWKMIPFRTRLRWRLDYIWRIEILGKGW